MKPSIALLAFLLSCAHVSPALLSGETTYGNAIVEGVTRMTTGSRFRVNIVDYPPIVGEDMPVYVYGVATAPLRGSTGPVRETAMKAKEFTESQLRTAKSIELRNMQRGKYFVVVADVYVDGKSLGAKLLKAGLAKPYHGGPQPSWP